MTRSLLAAVVIGLLSGCGTVGNLASCCRSGDMLPYGGVVNSVRMTREGVAEGARLDKPDCLYLLLVAPLFFLIDVPLCVVADTVTLPITIPVTLKALIDGSR